MKKWRRSCCRYRMILTISITPRITILYSRTTPRSRCRGVGITDEAWRRHANPWSVYTHFAAIPAGILAIWSRTWFGWWALVPLGLVIVWLWLNPHVSPAVREPRSWAARGIYGERLWLNEPESVPPDCRSLLHWLIIPGVAGILLLVWGLVQLELWPTIFGTTLVTITTMAHRSARSLL
jgi:hypothetical protein